MESDPNRDAVEVFAWTEYITVPFPVPDAPDAMAIQLAPLEADQPQPLVAVMVAVKFPPAAAGVALMGLIA
jgi:hypothetical protein